jgi:geranylgeranyl diphosphate synthase, type I
MSNPFSPVLERVRCEVERLLVGVFEQRRAEARELGPEVVAMVDAVADLTMRGGKRFRPALLYASYCSVDERVPEAVPFAAGVALELLQTYFLIHDDWMDQDELRRGGPSVHVLLERHLGSRRLGESAAVLAGDYAAALALEALASSGGPDKETSAALRLFARIQQDTIRGQQIDLAASADDLQVERMHDLKTGSYTVRGPILLGATLAGAPETQLRALTQFAEPLGVAFQLRDDLLGIFGHPDRTGKPVGSDIRAGKRTSVLSETLRRASASERELVRRVAGRRDATDSEVAEVADLSVRCGARGAVEARLRELVDKAGRALAVADLAERPRTWLAGAADALTMRDR